eukprot:g23670.t1
MTEISLTITTTGAAFSIFRGVFLGSFFVYQWKQGRCGWEYLYYMLFLALYGLFELFAADDDQSWLYATVGDRRIPMLRQVFWLVETPIQLKMIYNCLARSGEAAVGASTLFEILVANQLMIVFGFMAIWFEPLSENYWLCCILSWASCLMIFIIFEQAHQKIRKQLALYERRNLVAVLYLFYFTEVWVGLVFMLGPGSFSVINQFLENGILEWSYVVAKCVHAILCWRYEYVVSQPTKEMQTHRKVHAWQTMFLDAVDPHAVHPAAMRPEHNAHDNYVELSAGEA